MRKYGEVIGVATVPIEAGDHVHAHNLAFVPSAVTHEPGSRALAVTPVAAPATFDGFIRPDGRVGTRNYLGVLTSVNCSATVAKLIARKAQALVDAHPYIDGVVALTHGTGCGMAAPGEGLDILRRTLRGYAAHPNFAGIVAVGLGCEVNQLADLDLAGLPHPAALAQYPGGGWHDRRGTRGRRGTRQPDATGGVGTPDASAGQRTDTRAELRRI